MGVVVVCCVMMICVGHIDGVTYCVYIVLDDFTLWSYIYMFFVCVCVMICVKIQTTSDTFPSLQYIHQFVQ